MIKYENNRQVLNDFSVITKEEINFQNKLYKKHRMNFNVERGIYNELTCITFRNEEERHNIHLYHLPDRIEFVETGYSVD